LFEETLRRVGGSRPLVVGDRLDTDIEGAVSIGYDSLLVMTGVTGLEELVAAPEDRRPSYVSADLGGLGAVHPAPERRGESWSCGGWSALVEQGVLVVTGEGGLDDWWRAVACAAWDHLDTAGEAAAVDGARPPSSVTLGADAAVSPGEQGEPE
jgi:hypothetical protein